MKRVLRLRPLVSIEIVVFCLILLFVTAALAKTHQPVWGETAILTTIYGLSDSFTWLFLMITLLGSPWVLAGLMTLLLTLERPRRALYIGGVGIVTLGIVGITKVLVGRPRPFGLLQREIYVTGYGFPSGHTALATALALSVYPWLPKKFRWLAWVWIALVAFSRLYLGVHAPLDIIGGFVIGVLAAVCVQLTVVPENRKNIKTRVAKLAK
jgi:glycosyltransferase 2 family protein